MSPPPATRPIHPTLADLLRERVGLAAETLGVSAITAAFDRRARERGLLPADYVALLQADPLAFDELVADVTVPETWFLRDHEPFVHLARELPKRSPAPYRVLSMPCSTGEEAYSVVIALAEAGAPPSSVEVVGWDVAEANVTRARAASYGRFSFRGVTASLVERYFVSSGDALVPRPEVRARATFARHNALAMPVLAHTAAFDAILCRNLFIYLTESARAQVMSALLSMLAPRGLLILGHADPWLSADLGLVRDGPTGAFALTRAGGDAQVIAALPSRLPRPVRPARPESLPKAEGPRAREAAPVVTPPPAPPPEPRPDLQEARSLADRGHVERALAIADEHVKRSPLDAEGHRLLGFLLSASGDLAGAEAALRRAVYLDPGDPQALHHLSLLAERRGDREAALRLRGRGNARARP